jgi:hypothetical protein
MRLPLAIFAIALGAVELAAGVQELVYLGVLQSQTYPLIAGTLGTLAGGGARSRNRVAAAIWACGRAGAGSGVHFHSGIRDHRSHYASSWMADHRSRNVVSRSVGNPLPATGPQ